MTVIRNIVIVLGDQLDRESSALRDFDPHQDLVWMAEVAEESTHVWSHKSRTALFLAAMRHFRDWLSSKKWPIQYRQLDDDENKGTLSEELTAAIDTYKPQRLVVVQPGDYRVLQMLLSVSSTCELPLDVLPDQHFLCSLEQFAAHAEGRKQLRLEFFYRELRRRHDILMDGKDPVGGKWNYDADNRKSFGKKGPGVVPAPKRFRVSKSTKEVLNLVADRFADHPGDLSQFDWPVTPKQAKQALDDFIQNRLADFGTYQDAMWTEEPYLFHSRLSAAMNLKLLHPREVIEAAEKAYDAGEAPLAAVEGFIRQVLGWREYVRGIYWTRMPDYSELNALDATRPLPDFYWTGETEMHCMSQAIGQTLKFGYAHHIQRLMVTGLFSLMYGVDPKQIHEWYLAVYVDAVEWVELPNVLGMSQFADGGVMASKPYAATGKYIQRMSNYCTACKYDPKESVGEDACPFTVLYWDFLDRHKETLSANQRMSLQVRNLDRIDEERLSAIRAKANVIRDLQDE